MAEKQIILSINLLVNERDNIHKKTTSNQRMVEKLLAFFYSQKNTKIKIAFGSSSLHIARKQITRLAKGIAKHKPLFIIYGNVNFHSNYRKEKYYRNKATISPIYKTPSMYLKDRKVSVVQRQLLTTAVLFTIGN